MDEINEQEKAARDVKLEQFCDSADAYNQVQMAIMLWGMVVYGKEAFTARITGKDNPLPGPTALIDELKAAHKQLAVDLNLKDGEIVQRPSMATGKQSGPIGGKQYTEDEVPGEIVAVKAKVLEFNEALGLLRILPEGAESDTLVDRKLIIRASRDLWGAPDAIAAIIASGELVEFDIQTMRKAKPAMEVIEPDKTEIPK